LCLVLPGIPIQTCDNPRGRERGGEGERGEERENVRKRERKREREKREREEREACREGVCQGMSGCG
jgi:hypothetical protein